MEYINEGLFPYETDGLIFTPASLGVGQENSGDLIVNKKKTWKMLQMETLNSIQ